MDTLISKMKEAIFDIENTHQYNFRPSKDGIDRHHLAKVIDARVEKDLPTYPYLELRNFAENELREIGRFDYICN